jgi:hypothetical protein
LLAGEVRFAGRFREVAEPWRRKHSRRNLGRQGRELRRIGQGSVNPVRTQRNCRRSHRRSGGEQAATVDVQREISSAIMPSCRAKGWRFPLRFAD